MKLPLMPVLGLDEPEIDTSSIFELNIEPDNELPNKIRNKEIEFITKYGFKPDSIILGRHTWLRLKATLLQNTKFAVVNWKRTNQFMGYDLTIVLEPECCFFEVNPDKVLSTISEDEYRKGSK